MNLHKLIFTQNACYKAGKTITPKGIMVHSTAANNPKLSRYVGPDDGLLGKNPNNNHWNQDKPGQRKVCVHAFIGKLADGTIATYQTLPWTMRGWHAGGKANDTHIGFEICEDGLKNAAYFKAVYTEAVELCVYLCKKYKLTEKNIICHAEGHKQGIASNHGDVLHWWPKAGKSMDDFRADVKKQLSPQKPKPQIIEGKFWVEIISDDLNVRKGPGTGYAIVDNYKKGKIVEVLRKSGQWAQENTGRWLNIGEQLVKIHTTKPVPKPAEPKPLKRVRVIATWLHVRKTPGGETTGKKVYFGKTYDIYEVSGTWGKTKEGWISIKYCREV